MHILTDQDIDRVPQRNYDAAIRAHLIADAHGDAAGSSRHVTDIGRGSISVSASGRNGYAGISAEETFHRPDTEQQEQLVAGWDTNTGGLFGLAVGDRLGAISTGCIGGLALDCLAPHKVKSLALIGVGKRAEAQLASAISLRTFEQIRIYGRQPVAATALAKQFRTRTQTPIQISGSPEEAVHNADIVILATDSSEPVIDADWVAPHAHVTSIGPRTRLRHELPIGLVHRAKLLVSDSPQQVRNSADHFLQGEVALKRLEHLGGLVGKFNPDKNRTMTLFLSSGPAGADIAALRAAVDFLDNNQPVSAAPRPMLRAGGYQ